jgi:hypothetical protein
MNLPGKRFRKLGVDFDHVGDEVLLSLKLSEDGDEIDEVADSPHLFAGVQMRIRKGRAQTAPNGVADQRAIGASLIFPPEFLVPHRSPRWVLTAVAVLLLVATGLILVLPKHTPERFQTAEFSSSAAEPQIQEPVRDLSSNSEEDPDRPQRVVIAGGEIKKQKARRNPSSQPPVPEIATDFFPLTFAAEATTSSEGGHLVRVTIPRSALVAMGLPMNVYRSAEHVRADVVIGDDGLARAIRFIQ